MKKITLLLLSLLLGFTYVQAQGNADIPINEVYFPDQDFREYILDSLDLNHDGILSETERLQVSEINIYSSYPKVKSLDGINLFPNLQILYCSIWNDDDSYHLVLNLPNLQKLDCYLTTICGKKEKGLELIECQNLRFLNCDGDIESLDLNECPNLQEFHTDFMPSLNALNVKNCKSLKVLYALGSELSSLDLRDNTLLEELYCNIDFNHLSLSANTHLKRVRLGYCPKLRSLNIENLSSLKVLNLSTTALRSLNLRGLKNLESLICTSSYLQELPNLQDCEELRTLNCANNYLTYLDAPSLPIYNLTCNGNPLYYININTRAEWSNQAKIHFIPRLSDTSCLLKYLPGFDIQKVGYQVVYDYDQWGIPITKYVEGEIDGGIVSDSILIFRKPTIEYYSHNVLCKLKLVPDGIHVRQTFSDWNFANCLLFYFHNEYLSSFVCDTVTALTMRKIPLDGYGNYNDYMSVTETIDGLNHFPNLQILDCSHTPLKVLNLEGCTNLQSLICNEHHLTGLDLSATPKLSSISCFHNGLQVETDSEYRFDLKQLSHLDLSNIQNCEGGSIDENGILTFFQDTVWYEYLTHYTGNNESIPQALRFFLTSQNSFIPLTSENFPDENFRAYIQTHFDLNHDNILSEAECLAVTEINVNKMGIKSLHGIQHFKKLKSLHADSNQLLCLDLTSNILLESFSCEGNLLTIEAEDGSFPLDRTAYPDFDVYDHVWSITGGELYGNYKELGIQFDYHYDNNDEWYFDSIITYEYRTGYRGGKIGPQLVTFNIVNTYKQPDTPENPDDPDDPDNPNNPDEPDEPDNPDNPNPDEPDEPDNPDNPNNPDEPNEPNIPDDPNDPDEPGYPDDPWTSVQPVSEAPADLFSVHPVPFRQTLHIKTALNLKSVSLYNMQGRLCARFEHGFDALPTADLEPGLYLLLLETTDGATYRLKAVKE